MRAPLSAIGTVVIAVCAAVVSSAGMFYWMRANSRPPSAPVVVLDIARATEQVMKSQSGPNAINEQMLRMREMARQLRDAGYIVLDGQAVVAAPEAAYVDVPPVVR